MAEPLSSLTFGSPAAVRGRPISELVVGQRSIRLGVIALVASYLFVVLFAPLIAMAVELIRMGVGAAAASLLEPEALAALKISLVLAALSVTINSVVGVILALAIVRQRFALRGLVNALADLPLAV
ncbi:MAG TPA: hypothetical protein VHZ95_21750, partial [Polyangiales bacterium]|nr:hypothetical protein [Polyangiales bacterium]